MNQIIYKNAVLSHRTGPVDFLVKEGVFQEIVPSGTKLFPQAPVVDLGGRLTLPPFVEPHIHLDYVYTARLFKDKNPRGTLFGAIEDWSALKTQRVSQEIVSFAREAVKNQILYGVQAIRTHVDITDPSLTALKAILQLREELKPYITIQIVAFPQEGFLSYPGAEELMEEALRLGADVIGGIPHCEYTRELGVLSIVKLLDLAQKYQRMVDLHCDETDDPQSRFVENLAYEAIRRSLGGQTAASHTCAMGSYDNAYAERLFGLLRRSGIQFISCPTENLHLQGRGDTYPKRRGLTRVGELLKAGMNVAFAQDSIQDLWYPIGSGNPMNILDNGIHACQLTSPEQLEKAIDLITINGAKVLGLEDSYGIQEGKPASFIVLEAFSVLEAICKRAEVALSVREGNTLFSRKSVVDSSLPF